MLILALIVFLVAFLLITTRSRVVYKLDLETGGERLSYRSLVVITGIITVVWYGIYTFFSKDADVTFNNDFDLFED